jgi:hypothetical protein
MNYRIQAAGSKSKSPRPSRHLAGEFSEQRGPPPPRPGRNLLDGLLSNRYKIGSADKLKTGSDGSTTIYG